MDAEPLVVMLFFTVRVFLVCGFLYAFPRITRKGLMFGTYVGEKTAEGDEARGLMRQWDLGCLTVMAVSFIVGFGISLTGRAIGGNLTGTAVLLSAALLLYIWMYRKARRLAPPDAPRQAVTATASLSVSASKGSGFAWVALAICLLVGVATIVYAAVVYNDLPDQIPSHSNLFGVTDDLVDKSIVGFLFLPTMNLVVSVSFALLSLLVLGAKRSVRGGAGGRSAEAQEAFRVTSIRLFSGSSLCFCMFLSTVSVQAIRVCLAQIESLGPSIGLAAGATVLFTLAGLIWIMKGRGQGGALLEEGSTDAPLTGGLADNAHWIWGFMYIDRNDPSILVESRFGIGYTINLGNRTGLLLTGLLLLVLGFLAIAVTAMVSWLIQAPAL